MRIFAVIAVATLFVCGLAAVLAWPIMASFISSEEKHHVHL